jgi:glycosyltransferase
MDLEHIVIDGGSSDGTVEYLNQACSNGLLRFISEPDHGIYDAMNKGIKIATGEIIGILNSDDTYASSDVLSLVSETFKVSEIDSCYGNLLYVNKENTDFVRRTWVAGEYKRESFYNGWMPPHPTFFVRREIYRKYGLFNLGLGTAADYELMLRFLFKHNINSKYVNKTLIKMRVGGASNSNLWARLTANRMDRKAWSVNGLRPRPWTIFMKPARKILQFI